MEDANLKIDAELRPNACPLAALSRLKKGESLHGGVVEVIVDYGPKASKRSQRKQETFETRRICDGNKHNLGLLFTANMKQFGNPTSWAASPHVVAPGPPIGPHEGTLPTGALSMGPRTNARPRRVPCVE